MKTTNLIQNRLGAHASSLHGGVTSPPINHHSNSAFAAHGFSPPQRWRRRIPAPVVLAAILGICGLITRADVVYEPLLKFGDPEHPFTAVAFTPDGRQVLACVHQEVSSGSGFIPGFGTELWDIQTGQRERVFEQGVVGNSVPVAVSPDGGSGLTGSAGNIAKLWDLETGELIRTLVGHTNTVTTVAFSPDGQQALTGSADNTVRLWDTRTGGLRHTLVLTNSLASAVFSPDGRYVLTGEGDPWVSTNGPPRLWDAQTGQLVRVFEGGIGTAAFAMGGRSILALRAGAYWSFSLWDVQTAQSVSLSTGCPDFTVSPDGRLALIHGSSHKGPPRLVDLAGDRVVRWMAVQDPAVCAAFSPDGRRLVISESCGGCEHTKLWGIGDVVDWLAGGRLNQSDVVSQPLGAFGSQYGDLRTAMISRDLRRFMNVRSGAIYVWDLASGDVIRNFGEHVGAIAFSPDGQQALAGSHSGTADHTAKLWDTSTGLLLRAFAGHTGYVHSVAFSPNGDRALTASSDRTVKLWQSTTGQLLHSLAHQAARVAFSPDGQRVLTVPACCGGEVRVWDASTGQLLRAFSDVRFDYLGEVSFSPNLRYVLGTTNLWDTQSGESVLTVQDWWFDRCLVSPDGSDVWAAGGDAGLGQLCHWDAREGRWLREGVGGKLQAVSPNGEWLLLNGERGPELWDSQTTRLLRTFEVESSAWQLESDALASWFTADGQFVLAMGSDGTGWVWDVRDRLAGLRTSMVGGKLEVRWELGTLQSAEKVNGPWQDVTNAVSPFQVDLAVGARFFRVKVDE